MRTSVKLIIVAFLALCIGVAYASPMLLTPINVQPYPRVPEGPKAQFNVDVVYANFNTTDFQYTSPFYNQDGSINHTETNPATNITYSVVLNITNPSDQPATLYEVSFAAARDVKVQSSILGGTILGSGYTPSDPYMAAQHFGGFVDGVYLDSKWVNVTWIPDVYFNPNDTTPVPYPMNLIWLTQARMLDPRSSNQSAIISGPLNPYEIRDFSADHKINGTIPDLPANASSTGTWFEGVPIAEYYTLDGTQLVTEMYINGAWVDVTGRVTANNQQPILTITDTLVNEVRTVAAQPYLNMNATAGPVTSLPKWGSWGTGQALFVFPWNWSKWNFNNTFAPHESKLIEFNHTQMASPSLPGIEVLQTGNLTLYASASNYLSNKPINGTFINTASTTTQVTQLHLEQTPDGYVYKGVLGDNQTFQQINSIEVKIVPRTES